MKKAIITFTILLIITIGFSIYEGYLYITSLNTLNEITVNKTELVDANIKQEQTNGELEVQYNQQSQNLIDNDAGCAQWKNLEEVLKKIKE